MLIKEVYQKDLERIRGMLESGMSYAELARVLGTDPTTISFYTKEYLTDIYESRYTKRTYVTDNLREKILMYYRYGTDMDQIAEKCGTYLVNVQRVVQEHLQAQAIIVADDRFNPVISQGRPVLPDVVINGKRYKDRFYDFAGW